MSDLISSKILLDSDILAYKNPHMFLDYINNFLFIKIVRVYFYTILNYCSYKYHLYNPEINSKYYN